ncbi:hypothetical protein U3516DRAFT_752397 [Neocallimastix sp. 'constans']
MKFGSSYKKHIYNSNKTPFANYHNCNNNNNKNNYNNNNNISNKNDDYSNKSDNLYPMKMKAFTLVTTKIIKFKKKKHDFHLIFKTYKTKQLKRNNKYLNSKKSSKKELLKGFQNCSNGAFYIKIFITLNSLMKINKKNELTIVTLAKTAHQNAKIIYSILDSNKVIKKSVYSVLPSVLTLSLFGTINIYVNISIYTITFFNFSISSLTTIKKLNSQEVTREFESDYEDNINHLLLNVLIGGHSYKSEAMSTDPYFIGLAANLTRTITRITRSKNATVAIYVDVQTIRPNERRPSVVTSDTSGSMDDRNTTSTSTTALDIIGAFESIKTYFTSSYHM